MLRTFFRRPLAAIFAFVLALGIGAATLVPAHNAYADSGIAPCANTENSYFWFDLGNGYSSTAATEARAKTNTTPLFIWPQEKSLDMCFVYAEGWTTWGWIDYTVNSYGTIDKAGPYSWFSLKSNIYEYGSRSARITAWQCSLPGSVSGVWSPDSTREYTVCNNGYY